MFSIEDVICKNAEWEKHIINLGWYAVERVVELYLLILLRRQQELCERSGAMQKYRHLWLVWQRKSKITSTYCVYSGDKDADGDVESISKPSGEHVVYIQNVANVMLIQQPDLEKKLWWL